MNTSADCIVAGVQEDQPSLVSFAIGQARAARCALRIIHAGVPAEASHSHRGVPPAGELRTEGEAVLAGARRHVEKRATDLEVHYELSELPPREALARASRQAAVLVLGADDVPWHRRLTRTRISGHLARHAPCPVVVVPETADPEPFEGDVVLTLDGESPSTGPIRFAFEEARLRDGVLHVLHATPPGTVVADEEAVRANVAEVLAGWSDAYPDVMVLTTLSTSEPEEAVTHATERAGLVVVGRPHEHAIFEPGHSIAADVIHHAYSPVAVVPQAYEGHLS